MRGQRPDFILLDELAFTTSPWEQFMEEASKLQEVNSDDDPVISKKDNEASGETPEAPEAPEEPEEGEEGLLSDEDIQQLVQELSSQEDPDTYIKDLLDNKKINQTDIQKASEIMSQGASEMGETPEEERETQIKSIQEMVIRFSIYDKLNKLESKLELFINNFPNVDQDFFKEVSQIHEYVKIISQLIFTLEINLVYQLYANIEMKLINLFEEYQNSIKK